MKICIVLHSYSGITRGVAEKIRTACGGDLVEVKSRKEYSKISAYTIGCMRARRGEKDPIDPDVIDVTPYDLVVIGTPVWAFRATPAMNGAMAALKGCEGKSAVIFATCGGSPGETLPFMRQALGEKGMNVRGECVITKKDLGTGAKTDELIALVGASGNP
ncbi:MAG: ArsR family transcriptional regulator [Methanoregulaceae archaeon]|nr:ArsR family transcriptional regulator [Methanoregulaceae archaeon]